MIHPIEVIDMIRETTAMKVRQNLGELLNEVQYRKGRFVITKAGKPVAAIVDIDLFERIRRLDDEFEALTRKMVDAFAGVEPEKGMKLVDEAVTAARRKKTRR
jgi:prevent-host-death family protein